MKLLKRLLKYFTLKKNNMNIDTVTTTKNGVLGREVTVDGVKFFNPVGYLVPIKKFNSSEN